MKILAIEASGPVAGCAVLEDGLLIADYNVQYKKKHAQSLVPMMDEIKRMLELDLQTVDAVAIAKGPGSFTGLRIGAATAKGAAMAMDRPIIPVPTVDSIAYNLFETDSLICPLMDARRQQVYTGIYGWIREGAYTDGQARDRGEDTFATAAENALPATSSAAETALPAASSAAETALHAVSSAAGASRHFTVLRPQCVIPVTEVIEDLNTRGKRVIFMGDGVPVSREIIAQQLKVPYSYAPAHLDRQRAAAVAALAYAYWQEQGEACMVSADDFRPEYLRLAQAEQEHSERRNFSLLL